MKTKEIIKQKARLLFNEYGVQNVTLREVAKQIEKSYGNVTYHFSSKQILIIELFSDMNNELSQLTLLYNPEKCLLTFFLKAPEYSFDITLKYLFFSKDYVELKRNFPLLIKEVDRLNNERKATWLKLLIHLKELEYLSPKLTVQDLEYIMELSISIRMFYFQTNKWDNLNKEVFTKKVNRLLYPYLSEKGMKIYNEIMPKIHSEFLRISKFILQ